MSKYKIGKCMGCYFGDKQPKQKLPRKKKKLLKKLYPYVMAYLERNIWSTELCNCNLVDYFNEYKKVIPHFNFIKKNAHKINVIFSAYKKMCGKSAFMDIIDNKLCLVWFCDSGREYFSATYMEAIYNKEDEDETWSFSETERLILFLDLEKQDIKNFKDLINKTTDVTIKRIKKLL